MATAEEKYQQAIATGKLSPNEVIDYMRKHPNEEYRSWVKQTWDSPDAIPKDSRKSMSRIPEGYDEEMAAKAEAHKTKGLKKIEEASGFSLPDWMTSPDFLASIGLAGGAYAAAGAHAGMTPLEAVKGAAGNAVSGINQRMVTRYAPPETQPQTDIQRAQSMLSDLQKSKTQIAPQAAPNPEQIRVAKQNAAAQAVQSQMAPVQPPAAPTAAPAPVQPPVAAAPAPQAPTTVTEAVATNQSGSKVAEAVVKEELKQSAPKVTTEVAKQTAVAPIVRDAQGNVQWPQGMSPAARAGAESFAKQYPDVAAKLEKQGQFGILGFGSGDNNLYNTYGAEGRKAVLEQFHGGKPLGPYEPNYEGLMKTVRQGVASSDVPGLMARLPAEAEAGNFGQLGTPASFGGKKGGLVKGASQVSAALKAGGPALLLMSMADLAKAKTQEEKMNAGLGILGAILPPGMDIGSAGAPGVSQSQIQQSALLGSPYAQTEWAKTQRLKEKAGAGRGTAPASAYKR